jgi:hypothetical protein
MGLYGKTWVAKVLAVCLIMGLGGGLGGLARSAVAGVAVSPLKQEIDLKPGETGKAVLTLTYNNRQPTDAAEKLNVALADVQVTDDGALVFKDPGVLRTSASRWITLDANDVALQPGESRPFECHVKVPENAAPGEYYAAVLVTLGTAGKTDKGVQVQYRIASGLFITVQGRTYPKEARIARCELLWPSSTAATAPATAPSATQPAEAKPEVPRVSVLLENTGQARFDGSGKLTVYDEQKRIVQVSSMMTRRPCIFAGDSRVFEAEITKPLAAGKYLMQVEMDYQSSWAKVRKEMRVEILPEQAVLMTNLRQRPGTARVLLEATPDKLAAVLPPGATRSLAVTLKNVSDADVACRAVLAGAAGVTIRPDQFTIAKGGRKTVEVRVESAAGAVEPLSALLNVEASQEGGGHTELLIPVDIQQKTER